MLPLRFPNSGIKAKVFIRKIGFKLHVTRLNHIELFYGFLLHFHNEGYEERGRSAMARPSTRATARGQAKEAVICGHPTRGGACPWLGRRGNTHPRPCRRGTTRG
ncbi:hypothetical protein BHM03_00021922 [Ensete ventricosum]|nr:hypothetical protein BHM03_00021922 [Ensete ventricosum]